MSKLPNIRYIWWDQQQSLVQLDHNFDRVLVIPHLGLVPDPYLHVRETLVYQGLLGCFSHSPPPEVVSVPGRSFFHDSVLDLGPLAIVKFLGFDTNPLFIFKPLNSVLRSNSLFSKFP